MRIIFSPSRLVENEAIGGILIPPILMLLSSLTVSGCIGPFTERPEWIYQNKAAAQKDNAFISERILPDIVPDDAVDIRVVIDVDSNEAWGCFKTSDIAAMRKALQNIGGKETMGPLAEGPRELFRDFSWWPDSMQLPAVETWDLKKLKSIHVGIEPKDSTVCFHRGRS